MLLVVMMIMKQVDIAVLTDDLLQLAEPRKINSFLAKEKSDVEQWFFKMLCLFLRQYSIGSRVRMSEIA